MPKNESLTNERLFIKYSRNLSLLKTTTLILLCCKNSGRNYFHLPKSLPTTVHHLFESLFFNVVFILEYPSGKRSIPGNNFPENWSFRKMYLGEMGYPGNVFPRNGIELVIHKETLPSELLRFFFKNTK